MKKNFVVAYLMPLIYSLFFTGAMSALLWITVTYGSLNAVPIAAGLCAALYTCVAFASIVNFFRGNKLFSGSSADVLSVSAQKTIRVAGILVALPALIYCAIFAYTLKSYADTADVSQVANFASFEMSVFGKSKIWDFICPSHNCTAPQPVAEQPTVSQQKDVDFGPYMSVLQKKIKRAWYPPSCSESKRVSVLFKVLEDGSTSAIRIKKSAGIALADQAALKAVENAGPFKSLPEGSPPSVDIEFTFDYNVFGQGDNSVQDSAGGDTFSSSSGDASYGDAFSSAAAESDAEAVKPVD